MGQAATCHSDRADQISSIRTPTHRPEASRPEVTVITARAHNRLANFPALRRKQTGFHALSGEIFRNFFAAPLQSLSANNLKLRRSKGSPIGFFIARASFSPNGIHKLSRSSFISV